MRCAATRHVADLSNAPTAWQQTPKIEAADSADRTWCAEGRLRLRRTCETEADRALDFRTCAELSEETLENLSEAVRACDEVTFLLTKIGSDLRSLSLGKLDDIFENGKEAEEKVKDTVRQISKELANREAAAEAALPNASLSYAKRILEERGEKRRRRAEAVRVSVVDPEKWAQRWNAVQKAQPEEVIGAVRDVWVRLNGGGRKGDGGSTPLKLPRPSLLGSKEYLDEQRALKELVVGLDNQLREKSKAREARLRKGDVVNRARLVTELRKLDTEVSSLSKQLAIYIVKVESGSVYSMLEEEAIEVSEAVLMRSSARSDDELAILAAELSLIEQTLAPLLLAVERDETELIPDEILERLGSDMRDLRNRLGIADEEVFPAWDLNWKQVIRSMKDSVAKVKEGAGFYSRGMRLFNADVSASIRLFWRAVLGDTLKPREVQTLRRTVRDVLTLIPFTIILIAPITPIGHVLVFGFLQKYFPGFFPSQFSGRRQELFLRYEELRNELTLARERLMSESEESTFKEVQAAVQALGLGSEGGLSGNLLRSVVSGQGDPLDSQDVSSTEELPSERALRKLERRVQSLSDAVVFSLDDPDESRAE